MSPTLCVGLASVVVAVRWRVSPTRSAEPRAWMMILGGGLVVALMLLAGTPGRYICLSEPPCTHYWRVVRPFAGVGCSGWES